MEKLTAKEVLYTKFKKGFFSEFEEVYVLEAMEEYANQFKDYKVNKPDVTLEINNEIVDKCNFHGAFTFCGDDNIIYCSNCGNPL